MRCAEKAAPKASVNPAYTEASVVPDLHTFLEGIGAGVSDLIPCAKSHFFAPG
jgi:hypothetical protein